MTRLRRRPSSKQIVLASSLGITNAASLTTKRLSKLIDKALNEQKRVNDERVQQARDTDMLALASEYTTLKKQSWRYHCGPCPMSGCSAATDGFVVDAHHNSWFCRKCNDKGTPIGFLIKRENLSFWEAVSELVGERNVLLMPIAKRQPVKKKEAVFLWGKDKWQRDAQRMVWMSEQRLRSFDYGSDLARPGHSLSMSMITPGSQTRAHHCDSDAARNYLTHERAISMTAARAWRLGQARVGFKVREGKHTESANAIIIPWCGPDGLIKAIQYRLIGGASRRFHSKYGGEKTIYGAHLLAPEPDKLLVIVEGEFNAISIWQEARRSSLPIDVISIGGEGIGDERLCSLYELSARYRGCAVWLDRVEIAQKVGSYLERAMLLASPGGHDANSLGKSGKLAGIVEGIYKHVVQASAPIVAMPTTPANITPVEPSQELYDLLNDAGWAMEGLYGPSATRGMELYKELEDACVDNDVETALKLHAQVKSLVTKQAWERLGAAQRTLNNALYL